MGLSVQPGRSSRSGDTLRLRRAKNMLLGNALAMSFSDCAVVRNALSWQIAADKVMPSPKPKAKKKAPPPVKLPPPEPRTSKEHKALDAFLVQMTGPKLLRPPGKRVAPPEPAPVAED